MYKDGLRAFFTRNLGRKIVSVWVALGIWFWVNVTSQRAISCTVLRNLAYFNKADDLRVVSEREEVRITVRGRRIDLMANLDKVRAFVDLSKLGDGSGSRRLAVEYFIPGRLSFQSIEPSHVVLVLESP